ARRQLALPADAEILLYAGALAPAKGVPELVSAATALFAARPLLHLVLVGEGIYGETARQAAAVSPFADRIHFAGQVPSSEMAAWMTACDAFCLPSHSEGCPNVVVEAISCGRPVIATNVGGIPELVDRSCGVLVPPRDVDALTRAIDSVLSQSWDPVAIAERSGRGWDEVAAETYDVCRRVAEGR